MKLLSISNLTCSYDKNNILDNLSLEIDAGQIVGLLGMNGAGKTTLLKCIGNTLSYSGDISFSTMENTCDIKSLSTKELAKIISYIPQVSGISIDLSCLDVVLMGLNPVLGILERPGAAMISRAKELLTMLDLSEYIYTNYQNLSQGQKQLCLLARTLISDASLLLLDEPESALDFGHRYKLINQLRKHISSDKSALLTLHDPQLTLNHCDKVAVIHDGCCIASFCPSQTPEVEIEAILSKIYGPLSVNTCYNRNNEKYFVVIASTN